MRSVFTFLRDEKGVVTIEFVLWVPIFVGLFVFRPSHIMKDRVNSGGGG